MREEGGRGEEEEGNEKKKKTKHGYKNSVIFKIFYI